ncbi:MAG: hydroxyacid dehydrogenase [Actinobacteria bacterium]|jgi:D-3-phosphoglycerate dehydrogenase|nr:hydroxyacid dehydrogenase [Actinomycetota bacterium]MBT3688101.1 hydroxyacid dehydrogenase [Actinomycetota bacterium]MBT4037682.1 hydroxyacid dehydrogenase [Actinomycetota bacterium]MBT4278096.1 hydroxyacid dehydrogenase [Actinomycetota bacterium]MBT4342542.1 hydroxyacid dehydrogenase [Actinomycetota bacterium]
MKILFADALPEAFIDTLRERGDDCVVSPQLDGDDLPDAIGDADVLIVRSTEVTAETIGRAENLGLVVRSGAGTNTIDCQAAADAGVYVCNVPGTNAVAVAELTMGLLLAIDRHIADATSDLHDGIWNKKVYSRADGLLGKTLGIVGVGEIGLAVAERARCFGMSVVAVRKTERNPDTEARIRSIGIRLVDHLDDLLDESDVVSIHVPGGPHTVGLVDTGFLAKMRPGAILLNTSRGEVVDEAALLAAIDEKGIRAGLDVFCGEPDQGSGKFTSELASNPSVVGTHHIGASTQQAQDATSAGTIEVIEAYRDGDLLNCVNVVHTRLGTSTITIRHYDRVGVLAAVFEDLRKSEINVQTMQNKVFEGETAAVAVIDVSGEVPEKLTDRLACLDHVIRVRVTHHNR